MADKVKHQIEIKKVFIHNLGKRFSEEGLKNILQRFGTIVSFFFNESYAIVEYADVSSATNAIYELNKDTQLQLKAEIAHERKIDTSKTSGGKNFNMFEKPVAPSIGNKMVPLSASVSSFGNKVDGLRNNGERFSCIKPLMDAEPRDALCFHCKQVTEGQCTSCLTSFCSVPCMRNAAALHVSFCQKLGYRDAPRQANAADLTPGNEKLSNTSKGRTSRENWCQAKKDKMESSRFKNFVPIPNLNPMGFPSRFTNNVSSSRLINNQGKKKKSVENGNGSIASTNSGGSHRSEERNVSANLGRFKSPALDRIDRNLTPKDASMNKLGGNKDAVRNDIQREIGTDVPSIEKLTLNQPQKNYSPKVTNREERISSKDSNNLKSLAQDQSKKYVNTVEEKVKANEDTHVKRSKQEAKLKDLPIDSFIVTFLYKEKGGYWVLPEENKKNYDYVYNHLLKSNMEDRPNLLPSLNVLGAAKYDDVWYRVKVTSLDPVVQIHFIDYGNTEICQKDGLKELPCELAQIEPLVFHLKFACEPTQDLLDKDARVRCVGVERFSKIVELDTAKLATTKPTVSISSSSKSLKEPMVKTTENILNKSNEEKGPNKTVVDEERFPLNCEVRISFISVALDVSLVRADEITDYDIILNDLAIACVKAEPMKNIPKVDSLVAARYKDDGVFYRARVVQCKGDEISVLFIDYGNSDLVTLTELRSLPLELVGKPPGAITVKLSDVSLARTSLNNLESQVDLQTDYQLVYKEKISNGVELMHNGTSLNKKFSSDKKEQFFIDNHKVFEPDSLTKIPLQLGVHQLIVLYDGEINPDGILYCAIMNEDTAKIIANVGDYLNECCNDLCMKAYRPHPKELCAAQFDSGDDVQWGRALALGSDGESRSTVFFVDFGNLAVIDNAFIRPLHVDLKKVPALANKCFIKGYSKANEDQKMRIREEIGDSFKAEVQALQSDYVLTIPQVKAILLEK